MILLIHTATPTCFLTFVEGDSTIEVQWEAGRELASDLLGRLDSSLKENHWNWGDINGIVAFQGPGSFTGLRIGLTVVNTIAHAQNIPIVGATGDNWKSEGLDRLRDDQDDRIVLPEYGGEAHITTPRK